MLSWFIFYFASKNNLKKLNIRTDGIVIGDDFTNQAGHCLILSLGKLTGFFWQIM